MQAFLDKTAAYIIDNYGNSIDKVCVVLPNRRAGLFLKKNLSNQAKKTIWSPAIYSIEDFIIELSGYSVIDPVYLQFELYEVHKEVEGSAAHDFGEFLKWGRVLLNDFNEIDMYLVDSTRIFSYLTDAKAISLWNLDGKPLTDFEIRYLRFYNSLKVYYDKLKVKLLKKNQVYQGLAYRKLAENIDKIETLPWIKVLFVGFNALTLSEEVIVSSLKKTGKAELIWDADSYYMDNEIQEAGNFIRKYKHQFAQDEYKWIENYFSSEEKKIQVIGVARSVGQVKAAGQVIKNIADQNPDMQNTAVVLNDESLTIPLLNSIPESINEFNLTMGLPLRSTPLFPIIDAIFNLQINILKFDRTGGKTPRLYYRDIIRVLEHPYLKFSFTYSGLESVSDQIKKSNKIFFGHAELMSEYFADDQPYKNFITEIFKPWKNNPVIGTDSLITFLKYLQHYFTSEQDQKKYQLELEYLFHLSRVFNKLKMLLEEHPIIADVKTFREIFNQVVQSVTIPFYGEPLKGLQVMGMLETRTLDFENIIMLSVNEGFIPSAKSDNSFIPFEIKNEYNLPTHHDRNSVFAYHFYRILQRAKNIHLLYNTEPGDLSGGDRSRYVSQLLYELPKYNPKIQIKEEILSIPPLQERIDDTISIDKSSDILDRLNGLAQTGFSTSALNVYRNCKLQFYFNYIARIEDTEEVEETIEASTLGTVVHDVLQILYESLIGKELVPDDIKAMDPKIEKLIRESFLRNYKNGDIDFGKNLLIVRVAGLFINRFLERETKFIRENRASGHHLIIKSLEQRFETYLQLQNKSLDIKVKLKGFFDRLDELGTIIRIIDYKTGSVSTNDLKLKEWDSLLDDIKFDKCFQLLLYSYIYSKATVIKVERLRPGIISFRNLSSGFMGLGLPERDGISESALQQFENVLKKILLEIYNPDIPFTQVENLDNCKYCSFKSICGRN
ncbi:MAG: PD-(D/E)XK nuclease family protein [Bacteroidales bacterium]|nr:PD-(D/E)XK nuclease family protein [Bacteroidales bacterium]